MNEIVYRERFFAQLECDRKFAKYIAKQYNLKVISCGRHLMENDSSYPYILPPNEDRDEFLDFIDGNGFVVLPTLVASKFHICPIYKMK